MKLIALKESLSESEAKRQYYSLLVNIANDLGGVDGFHESSGHKKQSFLKNGIDGGQFSDAHEDTFFTIGQKSNFISSKQKNIIKFRIPFNNLHKIIPDMRYDHYAEVLKEHKGVIGSDACYPGPIPRSWILYVDEV